MSQEYNNLQADLLKKKNTEINKTESIFGKSTFDTTKKDGIYGQSRFQTPEQAYGMQNAVKEAPFDKFEKQRQYEAMRLEEEKKNGKFDRASKTGKLSEILKNTKGGEEFQKRRVVLVPKDTLLKSSFAGEFKESENATRRAEKIVDKKTALFAKSANYNAIFNANREMCTKKFNAIKKAMEGRSIGSNMETLHDLSAFMHVEGGESASKDNCDDANKALLDKYLGETQEMQSGNIQGQDRTEAMDEITRMLFSIDVSGISFETDTEMVKNAKLLENIVNCVGAYERLMTKNREYFDNIDPELKQTIERRLDELRAVAVYYVSRRQLLEDEKYRTHYDHELSMEVDESSPDDQRNLAEKLMTSYVLGKNLAFINSGQRGIMPFAQVELHFVNDTSRELFKNALKTADKDEQRRILEEAYTSMDYLALK